MLPLGFFFYTSLPILLAEHKSDSNKDKTRYTIHYLFSPCYSALPGGLAGGGAGADVNKHSAPGPPSSSLQTGKQNTQTEREGRPLPGSRVWHMETREPVLPGF